MDNSVRGKVIIMGGGVNTTADGHTNIATVWAEIFNMAGGKKTKIGILATASGRGEEYAKQLLSFLNKRGEKLCGKNEKAYAEIIPIFMMPHPESDELKDFTGNWRTAVNDPMVVEKIKSCTAIFMAGGDQSRYVFVLKPNGVISPALTAIWQVYNNGGVLIGTSAGAAVMSELMFGGGNSFDAMRHFSGRGSGVLEGATRKEQLWMEKGLGFYPELLIDTHFLARGRIARLIVALLHCKKRIGVGIEEATALVIDEFGICKSVGESAVIVVDVQGVNVDARSRYMDVEGIRLHYIDHGDEFDLNTMEVVNWIDNEEELSKETAHFARPLVTTDILAPNVLAAEITKFADNYRRDSIETLAIDFDGHDPRGQRYDAYRFIFSRDEKTKAWTGYNRGIESYCVSNLKLDIKAIRIEFFD